MTVSGGLSPKSRAAASKPDDRPASDTVAELFAAALEAAPEQLEALLAHACAGRPALRAEVESLLVAYRSSARFLERCPVDLGAGPPVTGARVGPYRLIEEIGHGGMGTVYQAERADGAFEQQVALKLIRQGVGSEALRQRFLRERQIQARLEHPNIARVLDGGLTADGWPYFTMELVRGMPVTEYCDRHRLPIAARLELIEQACRAVQHAHANLVVHRDLKPSNMLVTEDGVLKLLDFGIAKPLAEDPAASGVLTRAGLNPLTPEYAAPEQLRGEAVTTATDIYVLGIVLHELLTGQRPRRGVLEPGDPEPPSDVVARAQPTRPGSTPVDVAAARATSPERLRRALTGDLDAIVLLALRAEPQQRYGSVEALAADLHRYRMGQPVLARPTTARDRVAKLVRRHRAAAGAAAAALLALFMGLAGSVWQARVAARERDRAEAAAAEASEVASYLVDLFRSVDPENDAGRVVTARELLDRGAAQLEVSLAERPLTRARLQEAMAGVYLHLRLLEPAARLLESAITTREREQGAGHPALFEPLVNLGAIHYRAVHYDQAQAVLQQALRVAESTRLDDAPAFARAQVLAGNLAMGRRAWPVAEAAYRRALQTIEPQASTAQIDRASVLNNLGVVLLAEKRDLEAEAVHRQALALREREKGGHHFTVAQSLVNLALVARVRGRIEAAMPIIERALTIRQATYGHDHPAVAEALALRADAHAAAGRARDAEADFRETLRIHAATHGAAHPEIAVAELRLAALLVQRGREREARPLAEGALKKLVAAEGVDPLDLLRARAVVAELRWRRGDFDGAVASMGPGGDVRDPGTFAARLAAQGLALEAARLRGLSGATQRHE